MAEGEGYIPPVLFRLGNSKALYKNDRKQAFLIHIS